jgi:hypothetical protein
MPMNALKKEEMITEEVAQDLVDPANLQTNREFKVVLNQRHEPDQKPDSSSGPPLRLWLIGFSTLGRSRAGSGSQNVGYGTIRHAVLLKSAQ